MRRNGTPGRKCQSFCFYSIWILILDGFQFELHTETANFLKEILVNLSLSCMSTFESVAYFLIGFHPIYG
jgi:hypothetical protein